MYAASCVICAPTETFNISFKKKRDFILLKYNGYYAQYSYTIKYWMYVFEYKIINDRR